MTKLLVCYRLMILFFSVWLQRCFKSSFRCWLFFWRLGCHVELVCLLQLLVDRLLWLKTVCHVTCISYERESVWSDVIVSSLLRTSTMGVSSMMTWNKSNSSWGRWFVIRCYSNRLFRWMNWIATCTECTRTTVVPMMKFLWLKWHYLLILAWVRRPFMPLPLMLLVTAFGWFDVFFLFFLRSLPPSQCSLPTFFWREPWKSWKSKRNRDKDTRLPSQSFRYFPHYVIQ